MQVFISYSHSDSPLAARVSEALRKAGLQVWDPEVNVLPGDNWAAHVGRAVGGREQLPKSAIPWIFKKLPWVDLPGPEIGDPEVKPIADALLGQT